MPGPLASLWYDSCAWLSFSALTFGWSLRLRGGADFPRTGPVLVIANHESFLDPVVAGVGVPRRLCYLARKTLFRHPAFAGLIRSLGAVPIDQEGVGKEGIVTVLQQLQRGEAVLVFPEGNRSEDGRMDALRPGIHLLLKRVQAPVVPVGLAGVYEAWPRHRALPVPAPLFLPPGAGTLAVSVGKPVDGGRYAKMPRAEVLTELFDLLHQEQEAAERLRRK